METQKIKTQICIVGAGPAGSTLSIFLAKKGIKHLIVDSAIFPRDKVCGDALDLNVMRVLNHIDPSIIKDELLASPDFFKSQGMRIILPEGREVDLVRSENGSTSNTKTPLYFVTKRAHFDNLLVEKMDRSLADVLLGTKIKKIEKIDKTWKLSGSNLQGNVEIECDLLIGADGDHSVVLKHVGERKIDRNNYAAAVRQYWKGINSVHTPGLIEIYFPKKLPLSYFWIFPLTNGEANVGYGMASDFAARKNINVREAFNDLIKTDPFLAKRFENAECMETVKGWGIPLSGSNRKSCGDGWMLVGDAASIVCPTSGEGVGSGMLSAYVAAEFIERAIKEDCFEERMFANYDREIHKRLRSEEKLFRMFNVIPQWLFTFGVNMVISSKIFQRWSGKQMHKWVDTAFNQPIKVNMN